MTMRITSSDTIIILLLISSVLLAILFIGIVLVRNYKKSHSLPYLLASLVFFSQSFGIISILFDAGFSQEIIRPFEYILEFKHLVAGCIPLLIFFGYLLEVKCPGKVNLRSIILSLIPVVVVSTPLLMMDRIPIRTLSELLANINRPDVWMRFLLVALYVIYPLVVLLLPYDRHRCLLSKKIMNIMLVLFLFLSPTSVLGLMFGYFPAAIANFVLIIALDIMIAFVELRVRIPAVVTATDSPGVSRETHFISKGAEIFDDPKIWMDPDMTAVQLARIIGTNRTYLSEKIKGFGYAGYSDMVNRKRVGYICEQLEKNGAGDIISLLYEAGFRSRSTASSEFKRIVGCTPSEYAASHHFPKQ